MLYELQIFHVTKHFKSPSLVYVQIRMIPEHKIFRYFQHKMVQFSLFYPCKAHLSHFDTHVSMNLHVGEANLGILGLNY